MPERTAIHHRHLHVATAIAQREYTQPRCDILVLLSAADPAAGRPPAGCATAAGTGCRQAGDYSSSGSSSRSRSCSRSRSTKYRVGHSCEGWRWR